MSQSSAMSAVESATSTAVGFALSWALTPAILLAFGLKAGHDKALGIVLAYTVLSFGRGWAVRRAFNWLERRNEARHEA